MGQGAGMAGPFQRSAAQIEAGSASPDVGTGAAMEVAGEGCGGIRGSPGGILKLRRSDERGA